MRALGLRRRLPALTAIAALAAAFVFVLPAFAAVGSPTVGFTNVSCTASGYSFTATGTGFDSATPVIVHVYDNLFPYSPTALGQPVIVTTDGSGGFTVDFSSGVAQHLPATVTVTDITGATLLAGPFTVAAVTC